ncbi:MAG: hypothetical protein K1X89_28525, partial [Myxococcaceae bacterium]|nr:hypothetical protein [Myxococcaceae bacterium]
ALRTSLLGSLHEVPSLLQSLGGEPAHAAPSAAIARPTPPRAPPAAPAPIPITAKLQSGRGAQCRVVSFAKAQVRFVSASPLAANHLTEVELAGAGAPFKVWLNVVDSAPAAGAFEVTAKPFALSGERTRQWTDLVRVADEAQRLLPAAGLAGAAAHP